MTSMTPRRHGARGAALCGLLAAGFALGGCAATPPAPAPDAAAVSPVLSIDQNARVLEAVNAALAAASEATDPEMLAGRVTGPALTVRTSQLQVAQIRGSADLVTDLPSEYLQIILPATDGWPRTSFAITKATDELQPPRLIALTQDSPRDPYKLWGWVQLRPGVTMPRFADPKLGSELLAEDDASLKVSPRDVVAQYADLITTGDQSAFVDTFEPAEEDPFRALLASAAAAQLRNLEPDNPAIQGTYTFSATPTPGVAIQTVRTADGGAMVLAALDATEQMAAVENAKLAPSTKTGQALLQGQTVTNRLSSGFSDMVALFVPPVGSDERVKLLGYSHVQTSATIG
ncbi:hypothetical protein ET495_07945 [Xylanimonas allomyrinae]|uniref:DUF8094 domain-containing protein n=1 Tax=Xylanimonas allomyrinae TaxID=2509459 RepID=A0A4P6EKG2_9MICO|nr:hypothetical protein [Xylanimonas allomyrinae]QAY63180.1 hypothetical protein ET495_07945 [Xylanimonas allomyrinae]